MDNYCVFDTGFDYSDGSFLYRNLCKLMPEERKKLIDLIEKEDCARGYYSDVDVDTPRPHTEDELETIIMMVFHMLFKRFPP